MPISALAEFDVRTTGADDQGGFFVAGAAGTDRSQQDSFQVHIDNSAITTSITANVITFTGYTPTSADVGNGVQFLTGTNVTAGFYEITAQTATTWTVQGPANLPTAGTTTDATAKMGGALLSPGKACSGMVAGNKVHVKYHASNVYSITSTTANASQGRISVIAGASTSVSKLLGYELVHEDFTGNRPTIQAAVNTMTMLTQAGTRVFCSNLILDQGAATGIVGVATAAGSVCHFVRVDGANATAGFNCASDSHLIGCEAMNGTVEGFRSAGATFYNCVSKDNSDDGWDCTGGTTTMVRCFSIGNTGASTDGVNVSGATARLLVVACVIYDNGDHGINCPGPTLGTVCINTITYGNVDTGIIASNGGLIIKCASGGNGIDFGSLALTQFDSITLTEDPFTDAAGNDFSLNNTAGGGALLREEGYPEISLPSIDTLSFHAIGAAEPQHSGEEAEETPNPSLHVLLALPTSPSIDQIGLLLAGLTSS